MQQVHISKQPVSNSFTSSDLKQFLPMHQQSAIQNLKIIFNNYALSKYPKNIVLFPDQNLDVQGNSALYGNCYARLRALWIEDFDQQSQHLKNSLSFACSLVNYLTAIDQDSPYPVLQQQNQQYVKRIEIFSISNGQSLTPIAQKTQKIPQKKTSIGFKFVKQVHSKRLYFLCGISEKSSQSLALACSILRNWNINRLKAHQISNGFDIDLLHRICEHLFCMGRGFVREVSDDYNTYHANVAKFLNNIQGFELGNEKRFCQAFRDSKLNYGSNLPQQIVVLKCFITLKNNASQKSIWQFASQIATQWLLQTPLNVGCSYASLMSQNESNDHLVLIFASHYQSSTKLKSTQQQQLMDGAKKIQLLLFDQIYRKPEKQLHSLKQSIVIMNKFQNPAQRKQLQMLRQLSPQPVPNSAQPPALNPNPNLNDSFQSLKSSLSVPQSQSQNPKKLKSSTSLKNMARLENQLYQLLKLLDEKQSVLSPNQMEHIIRNYIAWLRRNCEWSGSGNGVTDREYEALEMLHAINAEITADEAYLLIRNNISQFLYQNVVNFVVCPNRYERVVGTGKIICDNNSQILYKNCLKNGLPASRNTIIPYYLKKMIQSYIKPQISPKSLKIDQISVPQLVQVLQKKSYTSNFYSSLVSTILPQLFPPFLPAIQLISPILSHIHQHLLSLDHHPELVYTFLGQLVYEICYFCYDVKYNLLNNAVYMENKFANGKMLTIKEKKIIEIVREGGMRGFGFEVKGMLLPVIEKYKDYKLEEELIYQKIQVMKSAQLLNFYKIFQTGHFTPTLNKISTYLEYKQYFSSVLEQNRPLSCFILVKNTKKQNEISQNFTIPNEKDLEQKKIQDVQFHSISERILRSESGIFQDMVRLNPNVKIAGVQLRTAMKKITNSRVEQPSLSRVKKIKRKGQLDQEQAIAAQLTPAIIQSFQYAELALSLREKYLVYHTLSQIEKSYFRDCATTVVEHKQEIMQYIELSQNMKKVKNLTK